VSLSSFRLLTSNIYCCFFFSFFAVSSSSFFCFIVLTCTVLCQCLFR
jgi:hypothetical protein